MKKFLKVIGYILLMIVAIFGGEFVRDIGLGDSLSTFLIIVMIVVVAYYVTSLKEEVQQLQLELDDLKWDVRNSVDSFYHHKSLPHADQELEDLI
jgi:hypothetical protein